MMPSPADLRIQAARCLEAARNASDTETKKRMAGRAFKLAQQAEALERAASEPPATNGDKQKPG